MRRVIRFPVFALAVTVAGLLAGLPAQAQEFGSFTLKPGESRQFRIGATYRTIRLCNDAESAGNLDAIIGDHDMIHLAPGLCAEESGDTLQLRNAANGLVSGVYRRQYDFFDGF
jgi:hypothetical protein